MSRLRRRRRQVGESTAVTSVILFALPACNNDLDELFCESNCPEVADAAVEPSAAPILPRRPDEPAVPPCEDCVAQACVTERASCLEDDACTAQLTCNGDCDDPGCVERCRGATAPNGQSPFYSDLLSCMFEQCPTECQARQNWDCVENFDWPLAEQNSIDVTVRLATGGDYLGSGNSSSEKIPLAGATVRACDQYSCPAAQIPLDAANSAELTLPTGDVSGSFRGFFEIEGEEVGLAGTYERYHFVPLSYPGVLEFGGVPDFWAISQGWWPSASSASAWVFVGDCAGIGASRVRIEIQEQPNAEVSYSTSTGTTDDETSVGAAFFPELSVSGDTQIITIQAFIPDRQDPVARRQIQIRAGWATTLWLAPLTRNGD